MKASIVVLSVTAVLGTTQQGFAWGDDGHKTVALIAQRCLTPSAKRAVTSMLAADTDNLTQHDIASAATWADKYRDSNNRRDHYQQTQNWHFTDMEIDAPDLGAACFGRQPLPQGSLASNGPAKACAVDKIEQFEVELKASGTDAEERLMAMKFVLHFVGDLHQPLHSSDNHDRGGNSVKVTVDGFAHKSSDELHGFWDTQFVHAIGSSPSVIAKKLLAQITPDQAREWSAGSPEDWQLEAFNIANADAYGDPPLSKDQPQHLDADYAVRAEKDVVLQLSRAGVRLATVLNRSLGSEATDWDQCLRGQDPSGSTPGRKRRNR
jgi:nuclease S1